MVHMPHDGHHGRARLRICITICARAATVSYCMRMDNHHPHCSGWAKVGTPAESGGLMASLPSSRAASSATSTGTLCATRQVLLDCQNSPLSLTSSFDRQDGSFPQGVYSHVLQRGRPLPQLAQDVVQALQVAACATHRDMQVFHAI